MNPETVNLMLAAAIGLLAVAVLTLARTTSRGKVARLSSEVARELGLEMEPPGQADPDRDPRLWDLDLFRSPGRREVAHLMSGPYRGLPLLLADVPERPESLGPDRRDVAGVALFAARLLLLVAGALFLVLFVVDRLNPMMLVRPMGLARQAFALIVVGIGIAVTVGATRLILSAFRRRTAPGHLLILFPDPIPALPDFLIEPGMSPGPLRSLDDDPGSGPDNRRADAIAPEPTGSRRSLLGDRRAPLHPAFLDRADRVLAGRSGRWTLQGSRGRFALWISDWRAPNYLRPARSYRAVLDDALALRSALDPLGATSRGADEPRAPAKAIRSALERIRSQPGPNHGPIS